MDNKVELNYVFACDQTIVDMQGKISVIGIFDRIGSKTIPAIHPRFTVAVNISGVPGSKLNEKIEIVNLKDGQEKTITTISGPVELKEAGKNIFFGNFINTLFPNPGKYWIKVSVGDQVLTDKDKNYVMVESTV